MSSTNAYDLELSVMILAYLAGLATFPVLALIWVLISHIHHQFTSTNHGTGCNICDMRWGIEGDGEVIAVTRWRGWKHVTFSHPGEQGRVLMTMWRGHGPREWRFRQRLFTAFPSSRVTPVDVLARLPLISETIFRIAARHGAKRAA